MRKLLTPMLMAGFLLPFFSSPVGAGNQAPGETSQGKTPRPSLIGGIKDELEEDCGCGFGGHSRFPLLDLAINADGETAWMNIDGQDVKLKLTRSTGTKRVRIGSRYTSTFVAEAIRVFVVFIVTRLCIPYSPECETTGYNVTITVTKGSRRQTIRAKGQCGCT